MLTLTEALPDGRACAHLANQVVRSSTCPALVYGEAQGAESRKDFIHKMKIAFKELKETRINLKIVAKKKWLQDEPLLQKAEKEVEELIAIFAKNVFTATKNSKLS